ncbi:hypothetical protein J1N35_012891 [Gossypium stocksii]|uniref:Uncharacterized protein n=1 Tax=Gossypium stocksii TaxID=47602 RepID=A0A9D3VRS7_9ROSI|nr:hypothetical protein J1N35_012891 [Gossypium stocksii]
MHQNDGVSFTSSPLKIPRSQTPAFQLTGTRHLAFQLIDSLRNRFNIVKHHSTQFTVSAQSELGFRSSTRRSSLLCFASVSLAAEKQSIARSASTVFRFVVVDSTGLDRADSGWTFGNGRSYGEERVLVALSIFNDLKHMEKKFVTLKVQGTEKTISNIPTSSYTASPLKIAEETEDVQEVERNGVNVERGVVSNLSSPMSIHPSSKVVAALSNTPEGPHNSF